MENKVTELEIKDVKYMAKGSFAFDRMASKFAKEADAKDGEKTKGEVSGVAHIFQKLISEDIQGLVQFWQCALAHLSKAPKVEDIENAIEAEVEKHNDTRPLFQGAIEVLETSGFLKRQTQNFWVQMHKALPMVKEEEKEQTKQGIKMTKEMYTELMGKEPYSTTTK